MKRKTEITILSALIIYLCIAVAGLQTVLAQAQTESKNTNEAIADAQLEKLKLEIQELKNKDSFSNKLPEYIPLITTLIAVAGFCFTVYQFFEAQNKDRLAREEAQNKDRLAREEAQNKDRLAREQEQKLRDEKQIRSHVAQLLNLDPEQKESVGKIFFLLEDLNTLVSRNSAERQKITNSLVAFIRIDCNFDNVRHIHIDIAAMRHWPDYPDYLARNPSAHNFIIYKYSQALRHVHDEDTAYFESIKYEMGYGFRVDRLTEESRYLRFISLITGYGLHLGMLEKNGALAKDAMQRFQDALKNPALTEQLINSKRFPGIDQA